MNVDHTVVPRRGNMQALIRDLLITVDVFFGRPFHRLSVTHALSRMATSEGHCASAFNANVCGSLRGYCTSVIVGARHVATGGAGGSYFQTCLTPQVWAIGIYVNPTVSTGTLT